MAKNVKGVYEKRPASGIWWIRYADATGKIRREKAGAKSAAIKLYQKRKTEVLEGKKIPEMLRAKPVTISELADDALEYSREHKVSYDDDITRIGRITDWIGDRAAESITPQEIERWLSSKKKLRPATLNRYRAALSLMFRLGVVNGKVRSNPARLVRQRREENGRIRFLATDEEAAIRAKILELCPHHLPEFEFALNTGLRMGEQYKMTWDCVDFERRSLLIPRSKNGNARHVPLNDVAIAALQRVLSTSNGQPYVFLNRYGQRAAGARDWFDIIREKTTLTDFTWHCLRHTFASRLVMAGVDLRTVQELMGHKTIQMTVRYAHLAPDHQLNAVQRLCVSGDAEVDTSSDQSVSAPWRC